MHFMHYKNALHNSSVLCTEWPGRQAKYKIKYKSKYIPQFPICYPYPTYNPSSKARSELPDLNTEPTVAVTYQQDCGSNLRVEDECTGDEQDEPISKQAAEIATTFSPFELHDDAGHNLQGYRVQLGDIRVEDRELELV